MKIFVIIIMILTILLLIKYYVGKYTDKSIRNMIYLSKKGKVALADIVESDGASIRYKFIDLDNIEHFGICSRMRGIDNSKNVKVYFDKNDYSNNCSENTIEEYLSYNLIFTLAMFSAIIIEIILLYLIR